MAMIQHQKEVAKLVPYQRATTEVITPDGVSTITPASGISSADYAQHIFQRVAPWERDAIFQKLADPATGFVSPLRNRGKGIQWDTYDILFRPEEIPTPAEQAAAYAIVKDWATRCRIPGKEGARGAVIQDWHWDGGTPHIRVDVSRIPYPTLSSTTPMGPRDSGERNVDFKALSDMLEAAGFKPLERAGIAQPGAVPGAQPPQAQPFALRTLAAPNRAVLSAKLARHTAALEELQREAEETQAAIDALDRADELAATADDLRIQLNDVSVELAQEEATTDYLAEAVARAAAKLQETRVERAGLQTQLADATTALSEVEEALDLVDFPPHVAAMSAFDRIDWIEQERVRLEQAAPALQASLQTAQASLAVEQAARTTAETERDDLQKRYDALEAAFKAKSDALTEVENAHADALARIEVLENRAQTAETAHAETAEQLTVETRERTQLEKLYQAAQETIKELTQRLSTALESIPEKVKAAVDANHKRLEARHVEVLKEQREQFQERLAEQARMFEKQQAKTEAQTDALQKRLDALTRNQAHDREQLIRALQTVTGGSLVPPQPPVPADTLPGLENLDKPRPSQDAKPDDKPEDTPEEPGNDTPSR